ncbi:uncharacterized protein LOC131073610 isoform X7 [Cryptomeria japonica]|uniref:uncharacterized protein LOC131073610 isoform X7 n=1 Tax=Cryptomeria japonica TaxID=3369 RepID=UPI0025ABFB90|nr:uncharacterized protein LOC131073610 isoform X7 [Cryptomeria japonica]
MAGKRDLQIESNIWRDRMQYAFKLHSCLLGFSFANDRLPLEHGQVAIGVSIFFFLNNRGYIFSVIFCSGYLHNLIVFGSFFSYFQIQLFECKSTKQ